MNKEILYPVADGVILERIVLVDLITRTERKPYISQSLPGHLIHLVIQGHTIQETNGLVYELKPGMAVWYNENETVQGKIAEVPWSFYTINFIAPVLSPPPPDQRIIYAGEKVQEMFPALLEVWRNQMLSPALRHLTLHAHLLEIIIGLLSQRDFPYRMDPIARLWWDVESVIKKDLSQPVTLETLQSLSHVSLRTINRSAHHAVGMAPMKRIKEIRLSMARGYLLYSDLSITEIAYRVAYNRVQEFSRDYKYRYGLTPGEDRKNGPDYKKM